MLSVMARRNFLVRLAALPIVGAGASIFARRADAATASIIRQIDAAEHRHHVAKLAHDAAHEAFEAVFPKLHWTLDLTHQRPRRFRSTIERGFNGSMPKRYVNKFGFPDHRYVATVETLTEDLKACPFGRRGKMIRRMLRRARRHEAAVERTEDAFRLEDLEADRNKAQREVYELAKAIFARPATTLPEIRIQARVLRAFAATTPEQWGTFQAGRFGAALAANLDGLAA